ncbi:MAG: hypothetical protein AB1410_02455 [Acidobacteriota bacterium]
MIHRKKTLIFMFFLLILFIPSLLNSLDKKNKSQQKRKIPSKIAKIFDEEILTRETKTEIPINIIRIIYLPAQENNIYPVFIMEAKNSDIGFVESSKDKKMLFANLNIYARFYKMENKNIAGTYKEINIPYQAEEKKEGYNPEEKNFYTFGYTLAPGAYVILIAFSSEDLNRIGTALAEFSLPDTSQQKLDTTTIFFVKSIEELSAPEKILKLEKNCFTYGNLKFEPKKENVFSPSENLDIFYFVVGSATNPQTGKIELEINYSLKKGEETITRFPPQSLDIPIISQPIPLISEGKNLEPGDYSLSIDILDKISKNSIKKDIPFQVK